MVITKYVLHGNMLTPALHWNNYNTTWWCVLQYIYKKMNKYKAENYMHVNLHIIVHGSQQ